MDRARDHGERHHDQHQHSELPAPGWQRDLDRSIAIAGARQVRYEGRQLSGRPGLVAAIDSLLQLREVEAALRVRTAKLFADFLALAIADAEFGIPDARLGVPDAELGI
jgi:hypothetical protein